VASILLVDDDEILRETFVDALGKAGHAVQTAVNGKAAQQTLVSKPFDLVISDIQMPEMDGIELLRWIKGNKPLPVILMTGFSHILETQKAFEMGAGEFLTKPFNIKEVVDAIDRSLSPKDQTKTSDGSDGDYCRLPLQDFVSSEELKVNIHIRLKENKYVRVAHKGDTLPEERIESYAKKGVTHVYVKADEFTTLVGFNLSLAKLVGQNEDISREKKMNFLMYTSQTVLERAFVLGIDETAFNQSSELLSLNLSMITQNSDLFALLELMNAHANWIYAHSLGVSIYSVMIGKAMDWKSTQTLSKLNIAGLYHDIGKKEIELEVLEKNRSQLTLKERALYETHSTRGFEILQANRKMPSDVIQAVYEHHEEQFGQGFPRRLYHQRVHPFAKVLAVADAFCNFAIKNPQSPGCDAYEALHRTEQIFSERLDPASLVALKKVIGV
jgi:putative nucleotidyltransferase with HDIG domain